jgi:hypothetical protein
MKTPARRIALAALVMALGLAGCGSDKTRLETGKQARAEVGRMVHGVFGRRHAATAAPDPQQVAREGMAANAGPLMLATLDLTKSTSIFALRGENGSMRTWTAPSEQALLTRNGMLVGSRGFGSDMMSADTAALSALIHSRSAGQAAIELRYLDGLGTERPLPLRCTTHPGAATSEAFAGLTFEGTTVGVTCAGQGFAIESRFTVAGSGEIVASRQWIGPQLGYITLHALRR